MIRALLALLPLLLFATPAAADPASAFALISTAMSASFAGISIGSIATNLLASVAFGALAQAVRGTPDQSRGNIRSRQTMAGGDVPQSIVLGRTAVGGCLVAPPTAFGIVGDGDDQEMLSLIVALSDYPITDLETVIIDGQEMTFNTASTRDGGVYGNTVAATVAGEENPYNDRVFLRWHDGTQTTPDSTLRTTLGSHPDRPWDASAILTGVAYAILHFKWDPDVFRGIPTARFVVRGAKLYDPRRDSTVGGSGAHRWNDRSTWGFTKNPVVMAYNVLRGIRLADGTIYGLGLSADDLPLSNWTPAMNACDEEVAVNGGGTRARYEAGLEFSVAEEPLAVCETLGLACGATFSESGGTWRVQLGGPAAVSAYLTDDDLILGATEEVRLFAPLTEIYNGAHASFPNPRRLWESGEATPYYDPDLEQEDGDRQLVASLEFAAVSEPRQVRALLREFVRDNRRQRTATITIPPAYLGLRPGRTISWTSSANGFVGKLFEVVSQSIDPLTLCSTLLVRERNASDYDPDAIGDDKRPSDPSLHVYDPARVGAPGFGFVALTISAASGAKQKPALRVYWDGELSARKIAYQVREKTSGQVVEEGRVDTQVGQVIVSAGVLRATEYEARIRTVGRRRNTWSAWTSATTADIRVQRNDLADAIKTEIETAQAGANTALARVSGTGNALDAVIAQAAQSADVDAVLARTMSCGWTVQPTFRLWSGSTPTGWTVAGAVSKSSTGWLYSTAALLAAPGSGDCYVAARKGASGQLNTGARLKSEYVVVSAMVEYVSGDLSAGYLQFQWRTASIGYSAGTMPLTSTSSPSRLDNLFKAETGLRQTVQLLFKRPATIAEADASDMRVTLWAGQASSTKQLAVIVHALDARAATEQEINLTTARSDAAATADSKITAYDTTIQGLLGAGAFSTKSVAARFGDVESSVSTIDSAISTPTTGLAARLTVAEATATGAKNKADDHDTRLAAVIAFKAKAGTGGAELELASTATNGLASSTARLRADNILLDGTVAMRHLVIGDFSNLVPDNQIQDTASWFVGAGTWTRANASGSGSSSIGAWRADNGAGECYVQSSEFPVDPDSVYAIKFQMRRQTGTKMRGWMQIRWYDSVGDFVSSNNIAVYDGTASATQRQSGTATSPSTATTARIRFVIDQANTNGQVRFSGPFVKRQAEAVEIKDGEIVAGKLAADSVVASNIKAGVVGAAHLRTDTAVITGSAQIADLTVDTINIKGDSIGRSLGGTWAGTQTATTSDYTLVTVAVPSGVATDSKILLIAYLAYVSDNSSVGRFRAKIGGTTQEEMTIQMPENADYASCVFVSSFLVSGGQNINLAIAKDSAGGTLQITKCRVRCLVVMK